MDTNPLAFEINALKNWTEMQFDFSVEGLDKFNSIVTINNEVYVVETVKAAAVVEALPDHVSFLDFFKALTAVEPKIVSEQ